MSQTKAQLISDLVQALNFTGTSSAPANGMYLSAANTIKLATNSNGRLTIDSSGNATFTGTCTATTFIGALTGNASGSAATVTGAAQTAITSVGTLTGLTVAGGQITANSSNATKYVRMYGGSGTGQWDIYGNGANLRFSDNATAGYIVFDHRVGIGTTAPTQALSVNAGSTDSAIAIFTGDDLNRGLKISTATENSQTDMLVQLEAQGQHSGTYEGEISLKTANAHRLRIDKDGNVGIGTTSPDSLLHLKKTSGAKMTIECDDNNDAWINFSGASNEMSVGFDKTINSLIVANADTIQSNPRLVITSVGNVGIGTTSPAEVLDVAGSIGLTGGVKVAGHPVVGYASTLSSYATRLGSTGTSTLRYTQIYGGGNLIATCDGTNGKVGIGTTSPSSRLQIQTLDDGSGSAGRGHHNLLELKHPNTTTTGDGPALLFNGYYSNAEWQFAKISADNRGSGYGADLKVYVHPADGTQGSNVVEAVKITGDGSGASVTVTNGDLVIGTSGHGINFSAVANDTTNTTSTGSLLDDYEEGTFTPTLKSNGAANTYPTQNYLTQGGYYTRVGRIVHVTFDIKMDSSGITSGSNYCVLANLPYKIVDANNARGLVYKTCFWDSWLNNNTPTTAYGHKDNYFVYLLALDESKNSYEYVGASQVTNNTRLMGSLTYMCQ